MHVLRLPCRKCRHADAEDHGVRGNQLPAGGYSKLAPTLSDTLPVWLGRVGYYTGEIGKFLNGYGTTSPDTEVPPGWNEWYGSLDDPEFSVGGMPSIGMMAKPKEMPAHIPSYWMPYFQVTNVDSSASKAKELGGKVMVGPENIPDAGRFAQLTRSRPAGGSLLARA